MILLAFRVYPVYELILSFNRDEYHDRPTSRAAFWDEAPDLLAGRDLSAGGNSTHWDLTLFLGKPYEHYPVSRE